MNRCYVCRRPGPTKVFRGRGVCDTCQTSLPRVLQLETNEWVLVKSLQDICAQTKDSYTNRMAKETLENLQAPNGVDIDSITMVLMRLVEELDPSRAKGHALELVQTPEGRLAKFACIMPNCDVCAVVGAAQELLRQLTLPP